MAYKWARILYRGNYDDIFKENNTVEDTFLYIKFYFLIKHKE